MEMAHTTTRLSLIKVLLLGIFLIFSSLSMNGHFRNWAYINIMPAMFRPAEPAIVAPQPMTPEQRAAEEKRHAEIIKRFSASNI